MASTESKLDMMHEAAIIVCMLAFVLTGSGLMLRYAGDSDPLPLLGGFLCMTVGAVMLVRTPGRFRRWRDRIAYREVDADEVEDENQAYEYDEDLVRVQYK